MGDPRNGQCRCHEEDNDRVAVPCSHPELVTKTDILPGIAYASCGFCLHAWWEWHGQPVDFSRITEETSTRRGGRERR